MLRTMAPTPEQISAAAGILAARRRCGEQGPRLPASLRPAAIEDALAIQAAVSAQLGAAVGGWKCGLPVEGGVVLAPIYAGTIHTGNSPCSIWARGGQARVEPELAFILGRDLPARDAPYTPAEVDAAIVRTHLALELIASRYSDPADAGFAENLADGLLNQGLFLGPQVASEAARTASRMALRVTFETSEEIELDGRHPAHDPRAPLYWLAEFLRSTGQGLQAGQAVITGSYAGSFDLPLGQDIAIRYGELGVLTVRFAQK
ncbi:2-keto-4-pentenoate hydratase [Paraherbaspirillum soli]|uniref:2-keto-4-pentenoate hydratase n=1 Tax=Paraherbaspirillum soli TaxID=631222 RepID=A0ABW0M8B5_9BURK